MKKCTIGLFAKIVTFLLFSLFFVPLTGFSLYMAFFYPQATSDEKLLFLAGTILFGGLVVFAVYRTFYLGLVWAEYDAVKIIFHYSRREQYTFKWEQIPGTGIQIVPGNGGYVFCITADGRQRKIPFNRLSKGYKDLEKMLGSTGVLHRIGVLTKEDLKNIADQIFGPFGK